MLFKLHLFKKNEFENEMHIVASYMKNAFYRINFLLHIICIFNFRKSALRRIDNETYV